LVLAARPSYKNVDNARALEESRDRFDGLYDFAPIGYMTLGTSGLVRLSSSALPRMERSSTTVELALHGEPLPRAHARAGAEEATLSYELRTPLTQIGANSLQSATRLTRPGAPPCRAADEPA
jgi:hypothetical protein